MFILARFVSAIRTLKFSNAGLDGCNRLRIGQTTSHDWKKKRKSETSFFSQAIDDIHA